jgi:tRNA A37 N6-isopentenylltransferase MiaA
VPLAERRGVPHHLIDFVSPAVNFTAANNWEIIFAFAS